MPVTLAFSPDTIRWRRAAIVELRKLGIHLEHQGLETPTHSVGGESASLTV